MKRVLLGMSGGVDSTVAAHLLQQQGYAVTGAMMLLWKDDHSLRREQQDIAKARAAADRLQIDLQILDLREQFYQQIVQSFIDQYRQGLTPNPCVMCNQKFKFDLMEQAADGHFDYLATGHYARVEQADASGEYQLLRAADARKDQSYVLYHLSQAQLARTRFPLGNLTKTKVREMATGLGFEISSLSDSQEICFISADRTYRDLLQRFNALGQPGNFVDLEGNVLGQHLGIGHYTVGQRKHLGIALGRRVFVHSINPASNQIVLADESDLSKRSYEVGEVSWNLAVKPSFPLLAEVAGRYQAQTVSAELTELADDRVRVTCHAEQRAVTPGQSAVFYHGDRVIGGGIIRADSSPML